MGVGLTDQEAALAKYISARIKCDRCKKEEETAAPHPELEFFGNGWREIEAQCCCAACAVRALEIKT